MFKIRVLIVEDEIKLVKALEFLGKKEGILFDIATDGQEGWLLAKKGIYDVIVLDVMLPIMDGFEILKALRSNRIATPVIMLTALDSIEDRVKGLDIGADDYLVKPFATQELFARIRSLYRRVDKEYSSDNISLGDISFNINNSILTIDQDYNLTKKEASLMEMFIREPERVFTREYILDKIWGFDKEVTENNIEIYIHYLRKKLKNARRVKLKTVRGVGYTLKEK